MQSLVERQFSRVDRRRRPTRRARAVGSPFVVQMPAADRGPRRAAWRRRRLSFAPMTTEENTFESGLDVERIATDRSPASTAVRNARVRGDGAGRRRRPSRAGGVRQLEVDLGEVPDQVLRREDGAAATDRELPGEGWCRRRPPSGTSRCPDVQVPDGCSSNGAVGVSRQPGDNRRGQPSLRDDELVHAALFEEREALERRRAGSGTRRWRSGSRPCRIVRRYSCAAWPAIELRGEVCWLSPEVERGLRRRSRGRTASRGGADPPQARHFETRGVHELAESSFGASARVPGPRRGAVSRALQREDRRRRDGERQAHRAVVA